MLNSNWRKLENERGFPFYLNEATGTKQWDHPTFPDIKQRIEECNYVKYSSYRLAAKIRALQTCLHMVDIPLSIISGVFERHKLGITEGSLCLESYDLEAVLSDIYFAANKLNHTNIDIDFATELMINFLYNVYDNERTGKIQVMSTKIVLAVLSNFKLDEFYKFIFSLSADHNNCITKLRLQSTLARFTAFTEYIHEIGCFGQHVVHVASNDCFNNSPGLIGITESSFLLWTETNPDILAWMPILLRMKSSELVVHNAKCEICKIVPIMGLRYKCMKCSNYNLCQRCFFTGLTNEKHKATHPMKEYCKENVKRSYERAFIKKLYFLMPCSKLKLRQDLTETRSIDKNSLQVLSSDCTVRGVEPISSPHLQLQIIIKQLELQNKELYEQLLISPKSNIEKYVEEHRLNVATLTHKLKLLRDCLMSEQEPAIKAITHSSTPMVPNGKFKTAPLDFFSPICRNIMELSEEESTNLKSANSKDDIDNSSSMPYTMNDISTWIGGHPTLPTLTDSGEESSNVNAEKNTTTRKTHNDLDEALAKLQQILANNFILDESLGNIDNGQLKCAVTEVEGMLTSLIDNVEIGKVQNGKELEC